MEESEADIGQTLEPAGAEGGTVVEGALTDISSLMPVVTDDDASGDFQATIFEPLFAVDPFTLKPVGVLAAAWEPNADASVWTIDLRDGVTWHDGEPFTADDVRFTYELHMHPDAGSSYTADLRAKIASIDVIDDRSIRFTLSGSTIDFPLEIGIYPIVARHIWASVAPADIATDPGATGEDPSRVIGTGPMIFAEWVPGDHATAVRNPRYWGGAPHIDAYVYKVVPDQATGLAQLKAGDIHLLQGVAGTVAAQLQGSDDIEIVGANRLSFTFYATNMDPEKTPLFQDANVRKALLYAIDRAALVDDIRSGYGVVAVGTLPPFSWAADPDGIIERYEYNPVRAAALLQAAGWADSDGNGVVDKNGLELSFTAYTNAGNPEREAYLKAIQAYWQAIGVRMEIRLEEYSALLERISISHDYEVVLLGFGWSATPDQSAMWACDSYEDGYNMVKYCNPAVDALAAEALNEADPARRRALYTEMQNLLLDDLPLAILDFAQLPTAVSTRLHNVFPSDINLYWNINTWWVE